MYSSDKFIIMSADNERDIRAVFVAVSVWGTATHITVLP